MENTKRNEMELSARYLSPSQFDETQGPSQLWSEILPGLWQGGTREGNSMNNFMKGAGTPKIITKKDFDTVITLYALAIPCDWLVKEIRYGFYDVPSLVGLDTQALFQLADIAFADWQNGKRVLISCQLGANRSGLVMALVLMRSGFTADETIALIRERRWKYALFNQAFVDFLFAYEKIVTDALNC